MSIETRRTDERFFSCTCAVCTYSVLSALGMGTPRILIILHQISTYHMCGCRQAGAHHIAHFDKHSHNQSGGTKSRVATPHQRVVVDYTPHQKRLQGPRTRFPSLPHPVCGRQTCFSVPQPPELSIEVGNPCTRAHDVSHTRTVRKDAIHVSARQFHSPHTPDSRLYRRESGSAERSGNAAFPCTPVATHRRIHHQSITVTQRYEAVLYDMLAASGVQPCGCSPPNRFPKA